MSAVPNGGSAGPIRNPFRICYNKYQFFVDRTTPHVGMRWSAFLMLLVLFAIRIVACQGFYVVAYALAIFLLNGFLLFLSPKFDPALASEDALDNNSDLSAYVSSNASLPTKNDEEYRPFIRRLPEFKFWYNGTWALAIGLMCTLFPVLDIPVFWPVLLIYFVFLFALTMRRQIAHMIKYKYVPFDIGKKTYV